MIHQIFKKPSDQKVNSDASSDTNADAVKETPDYSDVIVKKPWGYEYLAFENDFVAIWILQLVRKRKTSMHCHPIKKTSLILLSGEATCRHLDGEIELNGLVTCPS